MNAAAIAVRTAHGEQNQPMPTIQPILVVGAGPVGLAAAHRLCWHGCSVRIIDHQEGPTSLSKALVVWQRTLETLDSSLPFERFLQHQDAQILQGAILQTAQETIGKLVLNDPDSPIPTGLLLPQSATEATLIERLREQGVEVERNTSLGEFRVDANGITCQIHSADDGDSEARFPWMIGADGAHSRVRHGLDLDFPGASVDRRWILGDFEIDQDCDPQFFRACLSHEGMVGLFPAGHRRWRIIVDTGPTQPENSSVPPTETELQGMLDTRTSTGWTIKESFWLSEFFINERIVDNYRHGRILLAGDAAHVHSPAGGQGMNTGIQDAINLAWKLALVARGGAHPSLLDSYHEERHPVGVRVVENSSRMIRMAMLRNPLLQRIRTFLLRHLLRRDWVAPRLRPFLSETDIHYRKTSLAQGTKGAAGLQPGDRLPNLPEAGKPIYQSLRHPGATLLIAGPNTEEWPSSLGRSEEPCPIVPIQIQPEGPLARMLGVKAGQAVLVRPDAYIGTFARSSDDLRRWIEMTDT